MRKRFKTFHWEASHTFASRHAIPGRHYIKSVDLTVDGLAVPEVDELAAIPLDLWATERGYAKITPNLLACEREQTSFGVL